MRSIDEQIKRAIAEGKFEQLPGKGKPLRLDENPYENPEWRTAYHILRNSGFTLPWIESRREIEELLIDARNALLLTWELYKNPSNTPNFEESPYEAEEEWERALRMFEGRIETINQKIKTYNLEVPVSSFQILALDVERETESVLREAGK